MSSVSLCLSATSYSHNSKTSLVVIVLLFGIFCCVPMNVEVKKEILTSIMTSSIIEYNDAINLIPH